MSLTRVERVLQFLNKCGFRKPVIQAPSIDMTTIDLVSTICNSGALGSLGAHKASATTLAKDIQALKSKTHAPFSVFLNVPNNKSNDFKMNNLEEQVRVVLDEKVPIVNFKFGVPPSDIIKELKDRGTIILGNATSCAEAIVLQQAGCDAIVAQGYEGAGTRTAFLEPYRGVGTMALVPGMVDIMDETDTPVIAAGGIMDGRGVVAAFALGAAAVQMSTAFLVCSESGLSTTNKKRLISGEVSEQSSLIVNNASGENERCIIFEENDNITSLAASQACAQLSHGTHSKSAKDIISMLGKSSLSVMQEIEEIYQAVVRLRKPDHNIYEKKHYTVYE